MNKRGRKSKIDKKVAFLLWLDMSIAQAVQVYAREHGVNPDTGKPYTDPAIWRAANMYIIYNQDDARQRIEKKFGTMTDDVWKTYLLERANFAYATASTNSFVKWAESNGYERRDYQEYLEKRRFILQQREHKGGF